MMAVFLVLGDNRNMDQSDEDVSYFEIFYFPKITVILIILNTLIFSIPQIIFPKPSPQAFEKSLTSCIVENHSDCIRQSTQQEFTICVLELSRAHPEVALKDIPTNECLYSLKTQCSLGKGIIEDCFPAQYQITNQFGFVPHKIFSRPWTLVTSMFIHGTWMHLIGNMVALLLAGMFVEARLHNSKKYVVFYIITGIISSIFFFLFNTESYIPLIGASGAIFGLLGANLILNFYKPQTHYMPRLFGRISFRGFSVRYLVIVFILQILNSLSTGSTSAIAYVGHIGGFISGLTLIRYFQDKDDIYTPEPIKHNI
jgi:membrane associated rhomboid family serine protease